MNRSDKGSYRAVLLGISVGAVLWFGWIAAASSHREATPVDVRRPACLIEFADLGSFKCEREADIPVRIRELDGKRIAVRGFMLPLRLRNGEVTEFTLTADTLACCFGVAPEVNQFIHVKMSQRRAAPFLNDVPLTVIGRFRMAIKRHDSRLTGLYELEAEQLEYPGSGRSEKGAKPWNKCCRVIRRSEQRGAIRDEQ